MYLYKINVDIACRRQYILLYLFVYVIKQYISVYLRNLSAPTQNRSSQKYKIPNPSTDISL